MLAPDLLSPFMIFQVAVPILRAHRYLRSGALKTPDAGMQARVAMHVRLAANVKTDG